VFPFSIDVVYGVVYGVVCDDRDDRDRNRNVVYDHICTHNDMSNDMVCIHNAGNRYTQGRHMCTGTHSRRPMGRQLSD